MIAVDTNLLIYAHRRDSRWYEQAKTCIDRLWTSDTPWIIPWPCLHEFYGVVTHPKIHKPPSSVGDAIRQIDEWLASVSVATGAESEAHWSTLRPLLEAGQVIGPMVHDAKIAAICMRSGVTTLWTADRDFSRFPDLHCENPLVRRK